ncbi:MAG: PQQ-binding-like beta-propeller repeat protein [Candidatus Bathyarchaeia archaeon]
MVFSMTASTMLLPNANAHTPLWTIPTYAFLAASPNPVGVNQKVDINFWIDKVPPTAFGNYGMDWHNMIVTVTEPNGQNLTLGPLTSDATGGTYTTFVPNQVGNYTLVGNFPTQTVTNENPYPYTPGPLIEAGLAFLNDTYTASTSNTVVLNVQQQPIATSYPSTPLPTSYWTNPVNAENQNWAVIDGNWLGLGGGAFANTGTYDANSNYNPYTTAPGSAHVLWTKPLALGGLIGGEYTTDTTNIYATGTAYEPKFQPVIIDGILYYTQFPGAANDFGPLTAVSLATGQTLWTENTPQPLKCGMVYKFQTGDQYGAHAYLFTGPEGGLGLGFVTNIQNPLPNVWSMYDAMTGAWILNITNPNPGILVDGPNGETLSYTVAGGMMTMWNASLCIATASTNLYFYVVYSSGEVWRPPQGAAIPWSGGNQWSVPIATNMSGVPISLSLSEVSNGVALLTQSAPTAEGGAQSGWEIFAGYSTTTGQLLWGPTNVTLPVWTNVDIVAGDGIFALYNQQAATFTGYSLTTGTQLWGPTTPESSPWSYFSSPISGEIMDGSLYTWNIGGQIYCYNITTGAVEWSWSAGSSGYNTPYSSYPLWFSPMPDLADGMIYMASSHDYTTPFYQGAQLYCINATSGQELWSTLLFGGTQGNSRAIADGVLVSDNCYDNQIYAFGMGPSKTTVTAPDIGVTTATPITITGTVTDISPGAQQQAVAANFPNGLPCVSDASMSQFMEAVYQQQSMPTNVTGVPVTLSVVDANGNSRVIGTTTSDASGTFAYNWTPNIPGNYTITATFAGSQAYYGSSAETHIYASAAPGATAAPTATPTSVANLYFVPAIAGLFVLIIAVLAVVVLSMLRKRP